MIWANDFETRSNTGNHVRLARAAAERGQEWREAIVRAGQRITSQDTRPVAVGDQKVGTMVLDRLIRPRTSRAWNYILEIGDQVFVVEAKKALNVDIGKPIKSRMKGDKMEIVDHEGKKYSVAVVSQMSREDAMRLSPG